MKKKTLRFKSGKFLKASHQQLSHIQLRIWCLRSCCCPFKIKLAPVFGFCPLLLFLVLLLLMLLPAPLAVDDALVCILPCSGCCCFPLFSCSFIDVVVAMLFLFLLLFVLLMSFDIVMLLLLRRCCWYLCRCWLFLIAVLCHCPCCFCTCVLPYCHSCYCTWYWCSPYYCTVPAIARVVSLLLHFLLLLMCSSCLTSGGASSALVDAITAVLSLAASISCCCAFSVN